MIIHREKTHLVSIVAHLTDYSCYLIRSSLGIPAGLLHELYFAKDRPNYMNYGSFGTLMAHEMSHILIAAEDRSHQGDLRDWWKPQSLQKYDEHARCLQRKYAIFNEPGFERIVSVKLNKKYRENKVN